jgi:hypothetical protein
MDGVNLIKIYCKYICKCHNEPLLYNFYMLIKKSIAPVHDEFPLLLYSRFFVNSSSIVCQSTNPLSLLDLQLI